MDATHSTPLTSDPHDHDEIPMHAMDASVSGIDSHSHMSEIESAGTKTPSGTPASTAERLAGKHATPFARFSNIFKGGYHLRRIIPVKDAIVPSGPMASVMGSIFNLANATVGAGILGQGVAVSKLGLVLSPILIVCVLVIGIFCNQLMLRAGDKTGARTMPVLAYRTFGKPGSVFVDIVCIISGFGALCAYFVLLGDFFLPVFADVISPTSLLARDRVITMALVGVLGILPLAIKRNVNDLANASAASIMIVLAIVLGVLVLCIQGITRNENPSYPLNIARFNMDSFLALPILLFSLSNTTAVFPIFIEMAESTVSNFRKVQIIASGSCTFLYMLVGIMTYIRFGDEVQGNFLNNFPDSSIATLLRAAFAFTIITTYAIVAFPLRIAIEHLIFGIRREFSNLESLFCSVALLAGSFTIASITDNVEILFGLTGSLGSALLMFVVPGATFMKAFWAQRQDLRQDIILAGCVVGLGFLVAAMGVVGFADSIANPSPSSANGTYVA